MAAVLGGGDGSGGRPATANRSLFAALNRFKCVAAVPSVAARKTAVLREWLMAIYVSKPAPPPVFSTMCVGELTGRM